MPSFFDNDVKKVVPLIIYENGSYNVCESTMNWLETLDEFAIISCAGKYRTGKSFLLNRLANAEADNGFGVGDSVQACTKGLWIYKEVFEENGKNFLFVDTEGIDALDANDTHDVRIFTLALLISSSFIYNSVGPIDETALQTLSLMTRVTENVKVDCNNEGDLSLHMPRFYWVLRDFSLKLTDKDNNIISPNEYLENALQTIDPNKATIRDAIKNSFHNRKLVTLPRPTNSDISVQMENRLLSLSKQFTGGVASFRSEIFKETNHLIADSTIINGKMFVVMCRHFISVIESNSVPIIKDSWSLMASIQARDLKDKLLAEAAQKLSTMKPKLKDLLDLEMKNLSKQIIETFSKKSMKPIDKSVQNDLINQVESMCEDSKRKLEINITEHVEKSLYEIEPLIDANPEQLSSILNKALSDFSDIHDNEQEFVKTWMVAATERALCRWIPRSLQALSVERNEKIEETKNIVNQHNIQLQNLKEEYQEYLRDTKIKTSELEQLYESNKSLLISEQNDNTRLRSEIITICSELRFLEQQLQDFTKKSNIEVEISSDASNNVHDELASLSIQYAELTSILSMEKNNHQKYLKLYTDYKDRLEKTMSMQAILETNWKSGIEKLQTEQQTVYDKQKSDYEKQLSQLQRDLKNIESVLEKERMCAEELKRENSKLLEKVQLFNLRFMFHLILNRIIWIIRFYQP